MTCEGAPAGPLDRAFPISLVAVMVAVVAKPSPRRGLSRRLACATGAGSSGRPLGPRGRWTRAARGTRPAWTSTSPVGGPGQGRPPVARCRIDCVVAPQVTSPSSPV